MGEKMIIYIDVLFLNNTLMTLGIIWAVGHLLDHKINWWRLISAALIGTLYTLIIICFNFNEFKLFWHIGLNFITAIIMVYIAYGRLSSAKFWKTVGYLYLVSFITIGTTLSVFYIYGITPFQAGRNLIFTIFSLIVLFVIGKYGWHIFQKYITPDIFYVPFTIIINGNRQKITGLVDTGNKLNDPLTKRPVIVVELKVIFPLLTPKVYKEIESCRGGVIEYIQIFNNHNWGNRIRVLPFSDLGQEHGILLGLRPDEVKITYKSRQIKTSKVVLALTTHKLDDDNNYQALIHPQLLH